jgi:hypothetical protein
MNVVDAAMSFPAGKSNSPIQHNQARTKREAKNAQAQSKVNPKTRRTIEVGVSIEEIEQRQEHQWSGHRTSRASPL